MSRKAGLDVFLITAEPGNLDPGIEQDARIAVQTLVARVET